MKKLLLSLAALVVLSLPASVKADIVGLQPPPAAPSAAGCTQTATGFRCTPPGSSDMNDLDHHSVYTWRIDNVNLQGRTIDRVTLTFTNIRNWDSRANVLHAHLLDTARNSGLRSFLDDPTNSGFVSDLTDDFISTRWHSNPNWLVAPGTARTHLFDRSFGTTGQTWVYEFTGAEITALMNYIANGGNFAIGLDPDCHFFNDGIKLEIWTSNKPPEVPEPTTMALLGTGLAGLYARRRRQRRKEREQAETAS